MLRSRSIHNPIYYHIFYCLIIVLKGLASLGLCLGVFHSLKYIKHTQQQYHHAKFWCEVGLLFALFIPSCFSL